MRFTLPFGLAVLAAFVAFALVGTAFARQTVHRSHPVPIRSLRSIVDHYRTLTWNYERAAGSKRTRTAFSDRRSTDRAYLQWSIDTWTRRADRARGEALAKIQRRLAVHLPKSPPLHAQLSARVTYSRRLALSLRKVYPGAVSRSFARAKGATGRETLRLWQRRSAVAALAVLEHGAAHPAIPAWLSEAFMCIHQYEGGWGAVSSTNPRYYGGLQMDSGFQGSYGPEYVARWGTADNWPVWAQIHAAVRAYRSGRGFGPWPHTAHLCGLI